MEREKRVFDRFFWVEFLLLILSLGSPRVPRVRLVSLTRMKTNSMHTEVTFGNSQWTKK